MIISLIRYSMCQGKKIPILRLSQLWQRSREMAQPDLSKQSYTPIQLSQVLMQAFKLSMFVDDNHKAKIMTLIEKYIDDAAYFPVLVNMLLPLDGAFPELNAIYPRICLNLFKHSQKPDLEQIFSIFINLPRLIFRSTVQWGDDQWLNRDYSQEQQLLASFMPFFMQQIDNFEINTSVKMVESCKNLGVYDPYFSAYLIQYLVSSKNRLNLAQIINLMVFLSAGGFFPNDYYYRNQMRWAKCIEKQKKYSKKKTNQTIQFLELLVKENPPNSERVIRTILDCLDQSVPSFDEEETSRAWYLCNKAKFNVYPSIYRSLLSKIEEGLLSMKTKDLGLVVRGFSRFKIYPQNKEMCLPILESLYGQLEQKRKYERQIVKAILQQNNKSAMQSMYA